MADYVIDTNVWMQVDKSLSEISTLEELNCVEACLVWLRNFMGSDDRLAVDTAYAIFGEYRKNIKASRQIAYEWLNTLQRAPKTKMIEVEIEFDEAGDAILPDNSLIHDPNDRKLIAVALKFDPPLPIINATDTDWEKDKSKLSAAGIIVQELCLDYIQAKRREQR